MKFIALFIDFLLIATVYSATPTKVIKFPLSNVPDTSSRIFGGAKADDGKFPYMVFVLYSSAGSCSGGCSSCSASLIAVDKVLLAAHCFHGDESITNAVAVAGKASLEEYMKKRYFLPFSQSVDENALDLQERRPLKIKIHPQYDTKTLEHDVAIFSVTPFDLTAKVQPISLSLESLTDRKSCTIHGWGYEAQNKRAYHLVYASDHAVPKEECNEMKDLFICLQEHTSGICQGDSGSPLVCDGKVWGVASHILSTEENSPCGVDIEEFYADIFPELDFISNGLSISRKGETPRTGGASNLTVGIFLITILNIASMYL